MSLQTLENITRQFSGLLHINPSPLASVFIIIGMAILIVLLLGGIVYGVVQAFKTLPNMPFRSFVILMVVIATFLIVLGILIP
ncbi:hypothetical protein [Stygiolobus caldivivus]|uniref:Uncharacterized protein n=1 Tax=Stygiolobus caldivivus TaxID=2824673 RepID=A0A8D5ZK10_9CREN|nr:hypothetical protein [Stygiolobus caldivivus]BCU71236.1 hypothetical protein KN1_25330 [Stygiolobus caldivivus]